MRDKPAGAWPLLIALIMLAAILAHQAANQPDQPSPDRIEDAP